MKLLIALAALAAAVFAAHESPAVMHIDQVNGSYVVCNGWKNHLMHHPLDYIVGTCLKGN